MTQSQTRQPVFAGTADDFQGAVAPRRPGRGRSPAQHARLLKTVTEAVLRKDPEFRRYSQELAHHGAELSDYLFGWPGGVSQPREAFDRLRWGGQFIFVAPTAAEAAERKAAFAPATGFILERGPDCARRGWLGLPIPGLTSTCHYFIARKTALVAPGQTTDRFTYHVDLVKRNEPEGYVVSKQIPHSEHVIWRLRHRFPEVPADVIEQRARKLIDKVFPVFLTREAAFLNILERDLPEAYRARVPRVLGMEKDERGFVRKLYLNWLRNGGQPISQLDFARQSVDLLRVLHEQARIIHLDLRLDNLVITERGVGFVDFGSAVRVGEDLSESPMLATLFEEMMWTSSIQKSLGRMKKSGKVTSRAICEFHGKIDRVIDVFNISVQMNEPHRNPDFRDLVRYDPDSREAHLIGVLSQAVLKPQDAEKPGYVSAADVLRGLDRIAERLNGARR